MNVAQPLPSLSILPLLLWLLLAPTGVMAQDKDRPLRESIAEGVTELSPYFSVELSGGLLRERLLRTWHHANGQRTLLGVCKFSTHAPRQNGYAISADGKTLLYFHQAIPQAAKLDKPSGLYEFNHERGDRRVQDFANNSVYLDITLPRNTIVYNRLIKRQHTIFTEGEIILRDTEGNERRLDR